MENDNYYLLTLAAIAKEIQQRGEKRECAVNLGAGLPLAGFGREKKAFREYLLRSSQPVKSWGRVCRGESVREGKERGGKWKKRPGCFAGALLKKGALLPCNL